MTRRRQSEVERELDLFSTGRFATRGEAARELRRLDRERRIRDEQERMWAEKGQGRGDACSVPPDCAP